jgi:ATP phosphoribosyltransferase regulatory subunit
VNRTDRWLLPEGIEELLPAEASRLEALRRRLLDLYATWGYAQVMPPFIEYLESLLVGSGSDLDLETFKLTDQLTGRLMGVRADMTQQVARIDAHRLQHEAPTRLCYLGTVLRARPDGPGGSRSPLQVGAELYGHAGIESDAEVVALMIETLEACGIRDVHLDLGHVGIFRGLTAAAGLDELREAELFEMLQRKARAELEAAVADMPQEHASRLLALVDLNGGDEVLDAARERLAGATAEVDAALASLAGVAEVLRRERPELVLHFDLARGVRGAGARPRRGDRARWALRRRRSFLRPCAAGHRLQHRPAHAAASLRWAGDSAGRVRYLCAGGCGPGAVRRHSRAARKGGAGRPCAAWPGGRGRRDGLRSRTGPKR